MAGFLGLREEKGRRRAVEKAAVGLVQPLGAVAGADRHRMDRPGRPAPAWGRFGIGQDLCGRLARSNRTTSRLRETARPVAGAAGPGPLRRTGPKQRSAPRRLRSDRAQDRQRADKLPRSVQPAAKAGLREIWTAPDRATAEAAITAFAEKYGAKYAKAVACLLKDREALLAFYDFPAEHWDHLRTANPIESVFATVRHRTVRTKGALSQDTARLMVFKLVMAAAKTWRRLKGENQLPKVVQGVTFRDGVEVTETPAQTAA